MKLDRKFYQREDVVQISKELLGKVLYSYTDQLLTAGIIVETEAYAGVSDKGSHAYGDRNTPRTKVMYEEGGTAYVYLCYGIHSLFNVVTNKNGVPHAVLIRGIVPKLGIDIMQKRRKTGKKGLALSGGPGTVSSALGIHYSHTGKDLMGDEIWVEDHGISIPETEIIIGPRVGIDYAGEDALLPYRFRVSPAYIKELEKTDI